jgi:hypothetical protein
MAMSFSGEPICSQSLTNQRVLELAQNRRSAIFRSGSSVTTSVCTRSRKHTNAGMHANPIGSGQL